MFNIFQVTPDSQILCPHYSKSIKSKKRKTPFCCAECAKLLENSETQNKCHIQLSTKFQSSIHEGGDVPSHTTFKSSININFSTEFSSVKITFPNVPQPNSKPKESKDFPKRTKKLNTSKRGFNEYNPFAQSNKQISIQDEGEIEIQKASQVRKKLKQDKISPSTEETKLENSNVNKIWAKKSTKKVVDYMSIRQSQEARKCLMQLQSCQKSQTKLNW